MRDGTEVPAGLWKSRRIEEVAHDPDKQQMLELLKFELKFLEDGG